MSWKVFLNWLDVVKLLFFSMEIILSSCPFVKSFWPFDVAFWPFFLRLCQIADLASPKVFTHFLMGLFWFFSLTCSQMSFSFVCEMIVKSYKI